VQDIAHLVRNLLCRNPVVFSTSHSQPHQLHQRRAARVSQRLGLYLRCAEGIAREFILTKPSFSFKPDVDYAASFAASVLQLTGLALAASASSTGKFGGATVAVAARACSVSLMA